MTFGAGDGDGAVEGDAAGEGSGSVGTPGAEWLIGPAVSQSPRARSDPSGVSE